MADPDGGSDRSGAVQSARERFTTRAQQPTRALLVTAVAVVAVLVLGHLPASAQEPPTTRLVDIEGYGCSPTGIGVEATLVMDVPAGASVVSSWAVIDGDLRSNLGSLTTPIDMDVAVSQPYLDTVIFGGTWTAGLPFTYQIAHRVEVAGTPVYAQLVELACTIDGENAAVTVTETHPVPETTTTTTPLPTTTPTLPPPPIPVVVIAEPAPAAEAVTARPRFTR